MRVLFIINKLLNTCGVTSHTYYLIKSLLSQGNIQVLLLCGGGDEFAIAKFKALGIDIHISSSIDHGNRSSCRFILGTIYLYFLCLVHKVEIVHSHHHYSANMVYYVSKILKIKDVFTNHGLLPEIGKLSHFPLKNIIVVNEHILDYLNKNHYGQKKNIKLIRSGIPGSRNIQKELKPPIKFIAASRLVYEKGLDIFVRAISLLKPEVSANAEFFIAGEGESKQEILNLIKDLDCKVTYLGPIKNLSSELHKYDVFIMPSRSKSEGFPITLIEAGYAKNLIITSNFWGLEIMFKDGEDGLIFKIEDHKELTNKIEYVIKNYNSLNKLIENFSAKVRCNYSLESMTQETIKFYNSILNENKNSMPSLPSS